MLGRKRNWLQTFATANAVGALIAVAACTSTESTLDPNALSAPAAAETQSTGQATVAGPVTFRVGGVLGAPSAAVQFLTARLNAEANSRNVSIVSPGESLATHTLNGFLSTSPEEGKTVIFYVWDVNDGSGARVHRISGQQDATGTGASWPAVTEADMQAIADRTLGDLAAWAGSRSQ